MKAAVLEPRAFPLDILYEDDSLLVFFKPRGISMHPGAGTQSEITIANALAAHSKQLSKKSGEFRPGIVHRLDKDTEGLVVVAKDDSTHEALSQQFQSRSIQRRYWALVWGQFPLGEIKIEAPIGRHPTQRKKMAVVARGKPATTIVKGLRQLNEGYSWVECRLLTGRTHQIRVHLAHKKFPVVNDPVYARPRHLEDPEKEAVLKNLKGQALIAFELGFIHPKTKEVMRFELPPPAWLRRLTI